MNPLLAVTGTIYFWFFVAAVFFAAALNSAVSALYERIKKISTWSRHMPAFYLFISAAIAVLPLSVFFVDWKTVSFSESMVAFVFVSVFVFFVVFRWFLYTGLVLLFVLAGTVFLFNGVLAGWQHTAANTPVLNLRLLAKSETDCTYELTIPGKSDFFYHSPPGKGIIQLYLLQAPAWLFFVPGRHFVFIEKTGMKTGTDAKNSGSSRITIPGFRILEKLSGQYGPFSIKVMRFRIPEVQLLWLYTVRLNKNGEVKLAPVL